MQTRSIKVVSTGSLDGTIAQRTDMRAGYNDSIAGFSIQSKHANSRMRIARDKTLAFPAGGIALPKTAPVQRNVNGRCSA